tara:strand:+ start:890 stop:1042 length:153 start_codon:yes stop_codon:yes gene_type:complete
MVIDNMDSRTLIHLIEKVDLLKKDLDEIRHFLIKELDYFHDHDYDPDYEV